MFVQTKLVLIEKAIPPPPLPMLCPNRDELKVAVSVLRLAQAVDIVFDRRGEEEVSYLRDLCESPIGRYLMFKLIFISLSRSQIFLKPCEYGPIMTLTSLVWVDYEPEIRGFANLWSARTRVFFYLVI